MRVPRRLSKNTRKPSFERLESRHLLSITVSNLADSGNGSLRAAIDQADNTPGRDEIVFAAQLFTSGTPIIRLETPIAIQNPVLLHSPNGPNGENRDVQIQKAFGWDPQEALFVRPRLNGTGEDFKISDLIIVNFEYGIRVNDTGGVPTANAEGVHIVGNEFRSNERGIFLEDALYPFEIRDNDISGRKRKGDILLFLTAVLAIGYASGHAAYCSGCCGWDVLPRSQSRERARRSVS